MKLSEIDAEILRLTSLREAALKAHEEQMKQEALLEARDILGRMVDDLRRLEELGYLPPRLREALSDEGKKFNPGLYIKRPKLPVSGSSGG